MAEILPQWDQLAEGESFRLLLTLQPVRVAINEHFPIRKINLPSTFRVGVQIIGEGDYSRLANDVNTHQRCRLVANAEWKYMPGFLAISLIAQCP